ALLIYQISRSKSAMSSHQELFTLSGRYPGHWIAPTSRYYRAEFDYHPPAYLPPLALSASSARSCMNAKKAGDCPMKSPMSVKNLRAPMATPLVSVGRMTEQGGSLRLRNGQGSGMIRLFCRSSPTSSRSGKATDTPVTGSTAVKGGAFPALSCQV